MSQRVLDMYSRRKAVLFRNGLGSYKNWKGKTQRQLSWLMDIHGHLDKGSGQGLQETLY